jgi:hypothetical protein
VTRAAGLVLAVLLLAGCGIRPTGVVYAGDAPVATASGSPQSQVFFLMRGVLTPVQRMASPADPQQVFDALLKGPTLDERARGMQTELTGVRQISVHELDGSALLVETIPPALKLPPPAFAQIYCTGLLLSGQTVLKISYLDSGTEPYAPSDCPGAKAPPSSPRMAPSVPASGARP